MTTIVRPSVGSDSSYGTDPGDPSRARMIGGVGEHLAPERIRSFVADAIAAADVDGKRVCLVVPDGTRTCPLPLLLGEAHAALAGRAREVTVVIALGTHHGMSEDQLAHHLGFTAGRSEQTYPGWRIVNHESWLPETFTTLGTIGGERLTELTGGLMTDTAVTVRINRNVADADVAIVIGPVFPHEVVGFSGGNKYFFPGVSGQELIDLSHWVGALITSAEMIGTRGVTPVRALVNEAATLIPAERLALCLVVASGTDTLHAAAFGTPEDAWAACAAVSAETHVTYRDTPVRRVLSIMPTKYEDIWTAAKGFYKLEPIVADGGVGSPDHAMVMPNLAMMKLQHQNAPGEQALVVRPAVVALQAEQLLVPAAGCLDVAHHDHGLGLDRADRNDNPEAVPGRVIDLGEPSFALVQPWPAAHHAPVGHDPVQGGPQPVGQDPENGPTRRCRGTVDGPPSTDPGPVEAGVRDSLPAEHALVERR
jgi:nickel-dependent lactate racemase